MLGENDIGFAVRRLSNVIKRDVEKNRKSLGFDAAKGVNGWAINYFYENRNNEIFQRDFEEKFSIRGSTASRMLKTLEQKGFIERKAVESDGRLKKIVLTKKGISHHERVLEFIKLREEKLSKGLTEAEVKQFLYLIGRITENMEEEND